ncbi:MAG: major capsid protein [Pirellulales bacterium]
MAVAIPQLLQPAVINARVDRLKVINTELQGFWGMGKGGSAERTSPYGRRGSYDVFNSTRRAAPPSRPGSAATIIQPNPIGNVPFAMPRFHPSIPLLGELLNNLRPVGGPANVTDTAGAQYIADQEQFIKQQITNDREFQAAAMMRGSYTYAIDNPYQGPSMAYSGGTYTVDYQVPSGNKSKLNMLGGGDILAATWNTAGTKIIDHLLAINAAFIQLTGRPLRHVFCSSIVWGYVGANTQVQAQAGTANTYFDYITRDEETANCTARLRALPWLLWHISDNGLDTGSSFAFEKFFDDTHAAFTIEPDAIVAQYWQCGEPISEWDGAPQTIRTGEYYWAKPTSNPTGYQLFGLHNGIPVLQIPAGIAYGLVKY